MAKILIVEDDKFLRELIARTHRLDGPALALRVAGVHAPQVGGEQRGLHSPPAPARIFEDHVARLSLKFLRQQQALQVVIELLALVCPSSRTSCSAISRMSGSASNSAPGEAGLDLNIVMEQPAAKRGPDLCMFTREGEEAALVLGDLRVTEHRTQLVVTVGDAVELGAERGFHEMIGEQGRAARDANTPARTPQRRPAEIATRALPGLSGRPPHVRRTTPSSAASEPGATPSGAPSVTSTTTATPSATPRWCARLGFVRDVLVLVHRG